MIVTITGAIIGQYSQSSLIYNHWGNFYKQIRTAQYFLNRIDECKDEKLTEDERSWWKGEAYFLQAYYYFLLLEQYGPVPLVKKVYDGKEFQGQVSTIVLIILIRY